MEKILVTRATLPEWEEYASEIKELWDSHWLTNMGKKHNELQKALSRYLEVPYTELVVNGHHALELALEALGLTGEVITTPFTFVSTVHAIARQGLTPVFCDVRERDYTIDPEKIERLITEKTSAILPVHVYGNLCDVDAIQKIADRYHLKVIYDAAHAFGERYLTKGVAGYGDASCFSFHATKVFHTIEGGAVCTAKKDIAEKIQRLRDFGISESDDVTFVGTNAKMSEFSAAMGICNLRHIGENIALRRQKAMQYVKGLQSIPGIQVNVWRPEIDYNYSYFPVFIQKYLFGYDRDEVYTHLKKKGIHPRKYFYPLITQMACYRDYASVSVSVAERLSSQVLTLPLYPDLPDEVIGEICDCLQDMQASRR